MADDLQQFLVRPDVILVRGDVQIAHHDGPGTVRPAFREPGRHLVQEPQLVVELLVHRRVRFVTACGHIEVVHLHVAGQAGQQMAGVILAGPFQPLGTRQRHAGDGGDAVIALLAEDLHVRIAHLPEVLVGELAILALDLLQADHVRPVGLHEAPHDRQAQAHGVDVQVAIRVVDMGQPVFVGGRAGAERRIGKNRIRRCSGWHLSRQGASARI